MVDLSSIPPQILRNIFLNFVTLPNHNFRAIPAPGLYRTKDTPLFLGHVCSSWRQVVCSSTRLWSTILLHRPSEKHLPLLRLWLMRSGVAPLTLHIQSMGTDKPIYWGRILGLLLSHSRRWKHFFVEIHGLDNSLEFSYKLCSLLASGFFGFPVLDRLVIKFPPLSQNHIPVTKQLCRLLYQAPSLLFALTPFPCLQRNDILTAIICNSPLTVNSILFTLKLCQKLVSMDVRLASHTLPDRNIPGPIEHHNISYLRILDAADDPRNILGEARQLIFDNLTAPNLVVLDINGDGDDIRAIYDMILRSNCQITSLSKLYLAGARGQVGRLLRLPQLHRLEQLGLRMPSEEILRLLTLGSNRGITPVLPFLKFLDVQDILYPEGTALSDLLLSRFDSLEAAIITTSQCIKDVPLAKKLLSHPGYLIVAKGKDKSAIVLEGGTDGWDSSFSEEYVHHDWQPRIRSN